MTDIPTPPPDGGAPHQPMRFTVETWDPSYGVAADGSQLEETDTEVDPNVEVALVDWAPQDPDPATPTPSSVAFVDGIRRIDARVWITDDGLAVQGVCATVAAGAVWCNGVGARIERAEVCRSLYAAAPKAQSILTRHGAYTLRQATDSTPEKLYLAIHDRMTKLEAEVSTGVGADLVVFDGPLRGRNTAEGVGYIKTQQVQYLPDEAQRVVGRLGAGQRTPLFLIGSRGYSRWSWYMRLPGPVAHPLSGIVRCELPGLGGVDDAAARADQVTAALPRFASEPHKDPRAPQNLYPIAGLERELRRRLGDQTLMERALRLAAAS